MAKSTVKLLSAADKRRLARLAKADGAKSYADWLRGEGKTDTVGGTLLSAAKTADRAAVGYGAAGEQLSASGLADDGYASYLRLAAKEAREARRRELEGDRADSGAALLRGYAAYLKGEKDATGERYISAATQLAKGQHEKAAAEALIASTGADRAATEALRALWQPPVKEPELTPAEAIDYMVRNQMPSARALEYCLLIGYDEETARKLVRHAELRRSDNTDRLLGLMGH